MFVVFHLNDLCIGIITKVCSFALAILALSGCSTTSAISPSNQDGSLSYAEFNTKIRWSQATLELTANRSFIAKDINVQVDSTSFLDVTSNTRQIVPTSRISSIAIVNHDAGRVRGIVTGAILGVIAGTSAYSLTDPGTSQLVNVGLTALGAVLGGVVGNVIGSDIGFREAYVVKRDTLQSK